MGRTHGEKKDKSPAIAAAVSEISIKITNHTCREYTFTLNYVIMYRQRRNLCGVFAATLGLIASFAVAPRADAAELIMFDEPGCHWCAAWDSEIGGIYAKTEEGQRAPLRRVGLHKPRPEDLEFIAPVRFTPTFVLIEDGAEVARIEGYPGDAFFWGMLGQMLRQLPDEDENVGETH